MIVVLPMDCKGLKFSVKPIYPLRRLRPVNGCQYADIGVKNDTIKNKYALSLLIGFNISVILKTYSSFYPRFVNMT